MAPQPGSAVPRPPRPFINLRATPSESAVGLFKYFQPISRDEHLKAICLQDAAMKDERADEIRRHAEDNALDLIRKKARKKMLARNRKRAHCACLKAQVSISNTLLLLISPLYFIRHPISQKRLSTMFFVTKQQRPPFPTVWQRHHAHIADSERVCMIQIHVGGNANQRTFQQMRSISIGNTLYFGLKSSKLQHTWDMECHRLQLLQNSSTATRISF